MTRCGPAVQQADVMCAPSNVVDLNSSPLVGFGDGMGCPEPSPRQWSPPPFPPPRQDAHRQGGRSPTWSRPVYGRGAGRSSAAIPRAPARARRRNAWRRGCARPPDRRGRRRSPTGRSGCDRTGFPHHRRHVHCYGLAPTRVANRCRTCDVRSRSLFGIHARSRVLARVWAYSDADKRRHSQSELIIRLFASLPDWPFCGHEKSLRNISVFGGLVLVSGAEFESNKVRLRA